MTRTSATTAASAKPNGLLASALDLPNGARFYRCAFQVNPFEYLGRHSKSSKFTDEQSYNNAIVAACLDNGIEVIAITDHYRVQSSQSLADAATKAGIIVFPGFEAVTKDGVHFLCLFEPGKPFSELERHIGACGVQSSSTNSPLGSLDTTELLDKTAEWGSVCIAAHCTHQSGGLLKTLSGQTRMQAWRHRRLFACAIPGAVRDTPHDVRVILENTDPNHKRERPVAILNASDVNTPEKLADPSASCFIKMSSVSIEGLRQAFLDPESRVRLASDLAPEEHSEFLAIAWQAGFLDKAAIHFNENLNVLIGGRGAGKSTVVESLRYVLGLKPLGDEAQRNHDGIVRDVLQSGTKISLRVRSHRPAKREYIIERTVPNPPLVRDDDGNVLNLSPLDVLPGVEVYGQHEISELTKSREKLTRLLERFVERDEDVSRRKVETKRRLERSRTRILENIRETRQVVERLAALPALEETLKRFQEAGLEERLKEQSLIVREERVLRTADERVLSLRQAIDHLRRALPLDRAFLSEKALETLPGRGILAKADKVLSQLDATASSLLAQLDSALQNAESGLSEVGSEWSKRKASVQERYEQILRELQKSKIDGEEFIRLRRQIEELRPLKDRETILQREAKELAAERRNLVAEWEDLKAQEFRTLQTAAKRVTRALDKRVRVEVSMAGNREPLERLLRELNVGRIKDTIDRLSALSEFSLMELANAWRAGRDELARRFSIPASQAEKLVQCEPDVVLRVEELDLPSTTRIELNTAADGEDPQWHTLEQLSTGQKATAVLLLLLLESDAPLVVDQPEDDLDNRFITEGVVPKMRQEKRRRQFLFSTHNANIPVLGDAELIVGLSAGSNDQQQVHGRMGPEYMGSIDSQSVRALVEELLEGGKVAFEMRRLKYGF